VSQLRDTEDPDIRRLRDRVEAFIAGAKRRKASRRAQGGVKITRVPGSLIEYLQQHPFLAVVTAASLAWTLGHVSSAARAQSPG